jgi:RNA polymerase sigma-70 factor (ECF subfamily)
LRNRAEAEDAVQDAFLRVWQHRSTLSAVRNERVWLVRIVWNLAVDRKRRRRPAQLEEAFTASLISASVPADIALEDGQRLAATLRELEHLPKGERHVLLLAALEELSTLEIAAVLGRSESAIRALLSRARARLRERLRKGEMP